ncbi:lipopolysaccharide transport periplasmic protein LptA [Neptunomonas japonica]|uniref:lipopolysaccharide transport periplasmic protein LptA n=1 Tax=Neptunomonas japonica TaxID=417574 RepID=UPI0004918BAC|nr:lipopolysaccharide transport periplasmic protein LptA [Neptunomonas japonica]
MLNNRSLIHLFMLISVLFSSFCLALPTDRKQPIHISADSARIDDNTGTTTYKGNVLMTQGSMEIRAAKVDLYRKKDDVSLIIATGSPANFRQRPSKDQPITNAFGEKLEYKIAEQTVTITGQARVEQDRDTFSGERIVYQMKKAIVNAYSGSGSSGQRVKMIIQPKAN